MKKKINNEKKSIRIQFDITKESLENIDKLCQKQISNKTRSYIIRKSLAFYQRILELLDEGGNLYIEKNGEKIRLLFTDIK